MTAAVYLARDDVGTIDASIGSILPVVDLVVVVLDTRSSDGTREALEDMKGVVVLERAWNHSYGDARNDGIERAIEAGAEWIVSMDADERLSEKSLEAFRTMDLEGVDLVTCPLLVDASYGSPAFVDEELGPCGIVWRNRLFRAGAGWFRFRVHEQLSMKDPNFVEKIANIRFVHDGTMTWEKEDYYLALQVLDNQDFPDEPIPATMLAEAAIAADDTARASRFLNDVDQARVQDGPIAAKYWIARGKMKQKAWIQAAIAEMPREKVEEARDGALECYLRARDCNRAEHDAAIHAAVTLFTGFALDHVERERQAVDILVDVLERDPACVVASQMLLLYRDFGEPPNGDREVFCTKLGEFLRSNADMQTSARLEAEGRSSSEPAIVNVERLDEVLEDVPELGDRAL